MQPGKMFVLISCCCIYGCSDYPSGYKDGFESNEKNEWIVSGRSEYLEGFEVGKAEKFQQDWLAENFIETNQLRLQCPDEFLADPFMYLPADYKRVGPNTYKLDFQ